MRSKQNRFGYAMRALGAAIVVAAAGGCAGTETTQPAASPPPPAPPPSSPPPSSPSRDVQGFVWSSENGFVKMENPPPGVVGVWPHAINDAGEVTGAMQFGNSWSGRRAFVWSAASGFTDLGIDGAAVGKSEGFAINAHGTVTGHVYTKTSETSETFQIRAFVWTRASGMKMIPVSGKWIVAGISINSAGQVAGESDFRSFRWKPDGTMAFLQTSPGYPSSRAVDLNDSGDVLAYDGVVDDFSWGLYSSMPIIWKENGERVDIGRCNRQCDMEVAALNNRGEVAGSLDVNKAFYWTEESGVIKIPGRNGADTRAVDINDGGVVLVRSFFGNSFLWTRTGVTTELPSLPSPSRFEPTALNNKGLVVGYRY